MKARETRYSSVKIDAMGMELLEQKQRVKAKVHVQQIQRLTMAIQEKSPRGQHGDLLK